MRRKRPRTGHQVAIIGTGLIGASIGLALRRHSRFRDITGWDPDPSSLAGAQRRGAITGKAADLEDAIRAASTIVLAAPLDALLSLVPNVMKRAPRGALVIDVGPVKTPLLRRIRRWSRARPDLRYVSGHPLAGKERPGPRAADASLFRGHPFLLVVPRQANEAAAVRTGRAFARALGANPIAMSADQHDAMVAAVSALPQLAATAVALAAGSGVDRIQAVGGPGYRDTTRLALSPLNVWRPALLGNKANIVRAIRRLERVLGRIRSALERGDERTLARLFASGAAARRRVVPE